MISMLDAKDRYYSRVYLTKFHKYEVYNKEHKYLAYLQTLPEALHYRDLYSHLDSKTAPRPKDVDLKKDNPYLKGLKYHVPERLQGKKKTRTYGKGSIYKAGKEAYKIKHGDTYYCSCRTYEQAYYVCQELKKHNWDKSKLQKILDDYPKYYTELLYFYQYISYNKEKDYWYITIPKQYSQDGNVIRITYHILADALYERDFLREHQWDYELLVEAIDDTQNPYYDMELPPYPERRIRNVQTPTRGDRKLQRLIELLQEDIDIHQNEAAKQLGVSPGTIRVWLKKYDTDWLDIKTIIMKNENPLDILKSTKVYTPDLEPSKPKDFQNYIYVAHDRRSKYRIARDHVTYGSYPTRELALKIVKELEANNWDKNKLSEIQTKYGCKTTPKNNIYKVKNKWAVRKKIAGKTINYGVYETIQLASIVRNLLVHNGWDKEKLPMIKESADYIHRIINEIKYNLNGGL